MSESFDRAAAAPKAAPAAPDRKEKRADRRETRKAFVFDGWSLEPVELAGQVRHGPL